MWLGDEIKLESYAKRNEINKLPKWFEVNTMVLQPRKYLIGITQNLI